MSSPVSPGRIPDYFYPAPAEHANYTNFKSSLTQAEEIFIRFDKIEEEKKKLLTSHLQAAYSELHSLCDSNGVFPAALENLVVSLFYIYAKSLSFNSKTEASYQIALLSLMMSFVQLKAIDAKHLPAWHSVKDLEELPKFLSDHPQAFDPLQELLKTSAEETLISVACSKNDYQASVIAWTLFLVNKTCIRMDKFKTIEDCAFLEKIDRVVNGICTRVNTPENQWLVTQVILYNEHFVHLLKHPKDTLGALAVLEKLEPYLKAENHSPKAQILSAKIHNLRAIAYSTTTTPSSAMQRQVQEFAYKEITKACELVSTIEGLPFLKRMFMHTRAHYALRCFEEGKEVATPEEIDNWIKELLSTAQRENYNHYRHAGFFITAALRAFLQKNYEIALTHLAKADEINQNHPEKNKNMQIVASQLHQRITKKVIGN